MIRRGPPRILISAGEPSGDLHAAAIVRALSERYPDATIEALGGQRMADAGATIRYPMEGLAAFGVVEVVTKIRAHYRLLRSLQRDFRNGRYDLVVLVDYPGFHLRVAEAAHRAGTKVLYYIAPQLWAWRPERARRLGAAVDRLAVVLPFEQTFFSRIGIPSSYVGHPLIDQTRGPNREQARASLGIAPEQRVLGIFPGSRGQEIRRLWKPFREAGQRLLQEGRCDRVMVAGTTDGTYPSPGRIEILRGAAGSLLSAADAALVKSGTTTLEAALAGTPMVVAYRVHPLSWAVFQRLRTVRWVSLVNLVADREVVPELLQDRASSQAMADQLRPLLDPTDPRTAAQRQGLSQVRVRLGQPGASARVVALAGELLDP
ncbi:MAG TPA: lipid-A-disaccharide synthase [Gemmatimonadales bacterium]|nr:lipid-A-disaccharide synthase [Gemmatimonadales bacterium]